MSLRQKLLLVLSLTVAAAVGAVAWTVQVKIRRVFEQRDQQETALIVAQFQREFQTRSTEVAAAVERLAASERMRPLAADLAQNGDTGQYVRDAQRFAEEAHLDFLEMVGSSGDIVSSAQWPARFGYPEPAAAQTAATFLKREELPDGTTALGVFAARRVKGVDPALRLVGGDRLDKTFLAGLPVAPGVTIGLYATDRPDRTGSFDQTGTFDPNGLLGADGPLPSATPYQGLLTAAMRRGQETSGVLYLTDRREDSINATAIPLKNETGKVLAVLTVAISRSGMVAAQQHVRDIAYGVASGGIALAIIFSLWIAARVSRPIEELARAAEEVAAGNWDATVPERGRDEMTVLARSFNHMTAAACRATRAPCANRARCGLAGTGATAGARTEESAFSFAAYRGEPVRARQLPAAEFDEVFDESTQR